MAFEAAKDSIPENPGSAGIGAPDDLCAHLKKFEDSGVDQVGFIQQGGRNRHEHICELGRQITQNPARQPQIGDGPRKWAETAGILKDPPKTRKAPQ